MIFSIPANECCQHTRNENETMLFHFLGQMIDTFYHQEITYLKENDLYPDDLHIHERVFNFLCAIDSTYQPTLGMLYFGNYVKSEFVREIIYEDFIEE